ncbi:MAG: hypothetical protein CVU59_03875 [Deltaproteobacteria bacterium HGW-Deltaproteobacteria-17]|nr:MAG: hypothetical protein CVU59_03875 [Deltaproteobacteria bacterium HGW-Deltaproteobacteria-17]
MVRTSQRPWIQAQAFAGLTSHLRRVAILAVGLDLTVPAESTLLTQGNIIGACVAATDRAGVEAEVAAGDVHLEGSVAFLTRIKDLVSARDGTLVGAFTVDEQQGQQGKK